jgi:hypothetical protein
VKAPLFGLAETATTAQCAFEMCGGCEVLPICLPMNVGSLMVRKSTSAFEVAANPQGDPPRGRWQEKTITVLPASARSRYFRIHMQKLLFLSMIISTIVIPTRMSKSKAGPQKAVYVYLIACFGYYFALRFIIPRLPG